MKPWLLLLFAVFSTAVSANEKKPNIILVVGDGMGMEYIAAYRHFGDDRSTETVEPTLFDQWLVGTASTEPDGLDLVTDSAASATALAAGVKTYNGAIGLDINKQPVETLLERTKVHGYNTGLVATSQVNHATPASFAAHTESRNNYAEIANQYFDNRHREMPYIDLIMGGGRQYFIREDRNLVEEFRRAGYQYIDTLESLDKLSKLPALALLADDGMPHAIDSDVSNRLAQMTSKALQLMGSDKPFFLLVEASQVDWCGHANDIACAMAEMTDAEKTLDIIRRYIDQHPDTLVVVTADHSTGGLSMGARGHYRWSPLAIRGVKASAGVIAGQLINGGDTWISFWKALTSIPLDSQSSKRLQNAIDDVLRGKNDAQKAAAIAALKKQVLATIDAASGTGWTTTGHTGGDVPVMAYGKHSDIFRGHGHLTHFAERLFSLLPE